MTAIAVWRVFYTFHSCSYLILFFFLSSRSIVLTPGQKEIFVPQADLQIKNAALGEQLSDASGRTTVKLTYQNPAKYDDDEDEDENDEESPEMEVTTVLCSLTAGKVSGTVHDTFLLT